MTNVIAVIPARMGSSRFPGKPMALIDGKPMIEHVFNRVSKAAVLSKVVVATCDDVIFDHIVGIGGHAVMTSDSHDRASDRCAEAVSIFEAQTGVAFDIVVMVQGDEPLIEPQMIDEAVNPLLQDSNVDVVNLYSVITSLEEFRSPNTIKVVFNLNKEALYFSRSPIPFRMDDVFHDTYKQVCVIPFRRKFLDHYLRLEPTPYEIDESVDMMRILEHGFDVKMVKTEYVTHAVDHRSDIGIVEGLLKKSWKSSSC